MNRTKHRWTATLQNDKGEVTEFPFSAYWDPKKLEEWDADAGRATGQTIADAAAAKAYMDSHQETKFAGISATYEGTV